ncbi:hypothetical protein P171DRAFT_156680 [Karstenula rhodostoma CBS 690.94]|uniref:Uncharacterized protein n=1 Tax=Karstenula rhodostoma CBS 690.94 TaxID=1392251 RepID=A0A9P4P8R7_9PLEO|nr:hypothetical protein P171DRAFT_156680 [Karstenula rhodostoma CBS 690.94]
MTAEQQSTLTSAGDVIADVQHFEEPPKGTKRQRPGQGVGEPSDASENATGVATPESSHNKRRRKDSASAADAAVEKADRVDEKEKKKSEDEAKKLREQEEKAAVKAAKEKEKEEKKARDAAEKERKAAVKAAKDKERHQKKRAQDETKKKAQEEKAQKKRWAQQWKDYCTTHNVNGAILGETPLESITQTDACQLYSLKPNEMACLPHHPRINFKYKNPTKLFDEDEVRSLAFRRYAMLAGVEGPESVMFAQGKKLWEDEGERLGKNKRFVSAGRGGGGGLARDVDQGFDGHRDVNQWRDPRVLRAMGYANGRLPAGPRGSSTQDNSDDEEPYDYSHHEDY